MATATIRGVHINYEILGGSGPLIALITGGRRGYDEFLSLGGKLAAKGYRVLLHDRRNTGASDIRFEGDEVEEATWADDLHILLESQDAVPAFIGGASSGARTAILFYLRHPDAVRALLLLRVTGGEFAAGRLPENYYGQFIRAAEAGGMEAVCATDAYRERIEANPANREVLMKMDPAEFIARMTRWREIFEKGAHHPVMGVSDAELASIKAPTLVIPGNDKTHSSVSAEAAYRMIPGCERHALPVTDQDEAVIPFERWAPYEDEIVEAFDDFMQRAARQAA